MKSWLNFLSSDEYKQRQILIFIAEAAFLQMILSIILLVIYSLNGGNPIIFIAIPFFIFFIYILIRYIWSGIEYTDIFAEKQYKKKKRNIFIQSLFFLILLFISYMFILGVPKSNSDKFDMIVPILLIGILIYIINRISLKRSYKKNKNM
ncbi:DUF3278 domain-containing protein [Rummeliibacillus sp. TYF005]|uniref:DUF3278 domain-containing protein n=1 Tax=Rummeliibacillus sp. TYF005 TaxID=2058214 RepID=UPI000F539D4D|nr:DUF3278 domain-containing protein [Rummeliibacillus sp. TYF005]RPJ95756.1 DUF3278 domain-containing protein [Rummeliibacillus sp. TYF005]